MLITNAKIITMTGQDIPCGWVHVVEGKIAAVGEMAQLSFTDPETYDCGGLTLYPGFIDSHCHMGMWEEGLGFEGDDGNEITDPITPHLRAIDAINPLNLSFEEAVDSGVTTVVTGPGSANPISGQFCAMKTAGRCVDKMLMKAPVAMKFALGENPKGCYNEKGQQPTTRMATAALIRETLYKAKRYLDDLTAAQEDGELDPPDYDAKLEALVPVLKGELKAHIHCHRADDIFTALRLTKEFGLDAVLVHCTEGHLIAEELLEAEAKAICGPLICTRSKPELQNHTTRTPGILSRKGMEVAICTDYNVVPIEYLPISAGIAVREGMEYNDALKAITINAARICGIDDMVGSVEPGKDADLLLYSGDPLSLYEKPAMVFIRGQKVKG